ncbi:MAG: dTDP-4-dehydrorhamnose 3,5-epimerase family protein [Plesiomonas sp.]
MRPLSAGARQSELFGRGLLRGLHYQRYRPQGKLVLVVTGAIFDVVVDIRAALPTC